MTLLGSLGQGISNAFRKLLRRPTVDEKAVEEFVKDLQRALLIADVNVDLVLALSERVKKRALEEKLPLGLSRREHVIKVLFDELTVFLGESYEPLRYISGRSNVYMLVGIQGSGKTTTGGKLARYLKKRGLRVGLVCADTYRPGANDQLKQLSERVEVSFYGEPDAKDAVKVAERGVKKFKGEGYDVILVDTAGRHKEEKGLLKEMKEITGKIKPDEIILVLDGTIGQQAFNQAKAFNEATDIGSIIVTKLDGAAKGGGALSSVVATGAKIKYIGTGEKLDELETFDPPGFVGRLLDIGDMKGLLEKIKEAEITPEPELAKAFMTGKFTLRHLLMQLESVSKMGRLSRWLSSIPGLGSQLPAGFDDMSKESMKKFGAILQSMTQEELDNPKILDRSRINRIARGSGTSIKDIRTLMSQYRMSKKIFKQIKRGRRRGAQMPFMPKMPPD